MIRIRSKIEKKSTIYFNALNFKNEKLQFFKDKCLFEKLNCETVIHFYSYFGYLKK